ncbi:MAG: hypothetical protein JWO11_3573 [Nocardioides sp.]|nr:hypothetical protein [Nocardioides sp.]
MKEEDAEHGTYASYQQCLKRPEGTCEPCRKAGAEYMRQWRKDRPLAYGRERAKTNARGRAWARLAHMQPTLFQALYQEELERGEAS